MTNNVPTFFRSGASNVNETRNGTLVKRGGADFAGCVAPNPANALSQELKGKITEEKPRGGKEPANPDSGVSKVKPVTEVTPTKGKEGVAVTGNTSRVPSEIADVREEPKKKNKDKDKDSGKPSTAPIVTFDYGIIDGAHCTPLVANATMADPLVGKKVTVKGTEQAGIFYATSITLFQEATPQPTAAGGGNVTNTTGTENTTNTNGGNRNNTNKTNTAPGAPERQNVIQRPTTVTPKPTPVATPKSISATGTATGSKSSEEKTKEPSAPAQVTPTIPQIVNNVINNIWNFFFPPAPKPKKILGDPNTI